MEFVASREELDDNAFTFVDALQDGNLGQARARELLGAGWVYYAFRYGDQLAFAPAKFIGYRDNSLDVYDRTKKNRHGGRARAAISKVLNSDAAANPDLDAQLRNYCMQFGVELQQKKHSFWKGRSVVAIVKSSGIRDIDPLEIGNDDPEYRKRMAGHYVRDQNVRNLVLKRAGGICEFCGQTGFKTAAGRLFLETHHIISLSEQGADKPKNVIALCPNDHRRAHFGADWLNLQDQFLDILQKKTA